MEMHAMLKVICVCGARPNFMKVAPLVEAFAQTGQIQPLLVHTGQHYDRQMSEQFFDDLGLPAPDLNLQVGSGSIATQTAEVMKRFEEVCREEQPDWVVVVGDVNSTFAAAFAASACDIPVAHVEAGLRSYDRGMPEERNRVLTDQLSTLLFVSEPSGVENLHREGVDSGRVHLVGNVMIDTLRRSQARAAESRVVEDLSLTSRQYALVTLHRPSNVDDPETFLGIARALARISEDLEVVWPMHPRARARLEESVFRAVDQALEPVRKLEPLGYIDFLRLMSDARVVLTDSGGLQEETTVLDVPCLTLRENTERPITITQGTNRLVGTTTDGIVAAYEALCTDPPAGGAPELWDGQAARRVAKILLDTPVRPASAPRPAPATQPSAPALESAIAW
jgi:UDP-N-acetylglucosamine 2-epimerase (non-hydrolysing)